MARDEAASTVAQIQNPKSEEELIAALRKVKNDIIGHQQRKEMWVGLGVVEPVVHLMLAPRSQSKQSENMGYVQTLISRLPNEDETSRLQALYVIGSIAHGGPAFLAPLSSAAALPAILSNISPENPGMLITAALRVLCNLAESTALAPISNPLNATLIADSLFFGPHLTSLLAVLSGSPSEIAVQTRVSLAALLINKLCQHERHQSSLVDGGILDALARQLASVIVSQGMVEPGAERKAHGGDIPAGAASNANLAAILGAISVIIADSKLRASQLLYSSAIRAVFPQASEFDPRRGQSPKTTWRAFIDLHSWDTRPNAVDYLIPRIQYVQGRPTLNSASAFPPLGTRGSSEHLYRPPSSKSFNWFGNENDTLASEIVEPINHPESALIAYLIWIARSAEDTERLMAISVLTVLYRAGMTHESREVSLGLLIVPILVQLLGACNESASRVGESSSEKLGHPSLTWVIREQAPAVVAMLIVDSEYLQRSAFDAGIVPKLAMMLKAAYDTVVDESEFRAWCPGSDSSPLHDSRYPSHSSKLGNNGHVPLLVHRIKLRESVLRAIAALVPFKDEYRKAVIDQGVVPYIVESLKAFPEKPTLVVADKAIIFNSTEGQSGDAQARLPGLGVNPISVMIAACGAVRHLSRSVSILRTTLIDNGVALPVFNLLQHQDIDVQISATAAACNLVMEFSPMREMISGGGVLKILCDHAHSDNVKLRLNALWALKHLVQSAGNDVKKGCLEELGQGWLIQLISDDTDEGLIFSDIEHLGLPEFIQDPDDDLLMDQIEVEEDEDSTMTDTPGCLSSQRHFGSSGRHLLHQNSSRSPQYLTANARLAALKDTDSNPARRARSENLAVQEQGLDFIRNLIGGFNNNGSLETSEMIDFVFSSLGQSQIFGILASKLRAKTIKIGGKRLSNGQAETIVMPPKAEIITAVEYILVNMTAGIPKHRQLVIAQTELLELLVPLFNHPLKEVRLGLCWLVINLTWIDSPDDSVACSQRAQELKKLGFLSKLENLEKDAELDVRERAKTAVWQMKQPR